MISTSTSLLTRLRTGEEAGAWTRFVSLYTPVLFSWVRRQGVPSVDAADVVQEVFAVLVKKLPTFQYDRQQRFGSWLRTIAVNKCRDYFRQRIKSISIGSAIYSGKLAWSPGQSTIVNYFDDAVSLWDLKTGTKKELASLLLDPYNETRRRLEPFLFFLDATASARFLLIRGDCRTANGNSSRRHSETLGFPLQTGKEQAASTAP